MIKNKFGQIILEEDDLIDHVMTDPNKEIKHAWSKMWILNLWQS